MRSHMSADGSSGGNSGHKHAAVAAAAATGSGAISSGPATPARVPSHRYRRYVLRQLQHAAVEFDRTHTASRPPRRSPPIAIEPRRTASALRPLRPSPNWHASIQHTSMQSATRALHLCVLLIALAATWNSVSAFAPFTNSTATDIHLELTFPQPLQFDEAQGNVITVSGALSGSTGETPYFSVRAPAGARNRWMWQLNMTLSDKRALTHVIAVRSCSDQCEHPQPSILATVHTEPTNLYDEVAYSNAALPHMSISVNPRSYDQGNYPFRPANAGLYPNCACGSGANTDPIYTANETWWLRGFNDNSPTKSIMYPSLVTASASVVDICNMHGTESTSLENIFVTGCQCDDGWFGRQCTASMGMGYEFRPCCSDKLASLSSPPDEPVTVDIPGAFDYLRQMRPREKLFVFNASDPSLGLNATAGVTYMPHIRLHASAKDQTACKTYGAPKFFYTAVCDLSQLDQCITNMAAYEGPYTGATGVSDMTTQFNLQTDWDRYLTGEWTSVPEPFAHSRTRMRCGCEASSAPPIEQNAEKLILVKVMQNDAMCSYDIKMNVTQFCQNGGVYKVAKGCLCPDGFGGEQCQNACSSPSRGGPHCNETVYEVSQGVPLTFVSGAGDRTWFTFDPPAPEGRPRSLRIKVQGAGSGNDALVRVSAVNRCDESSCPIRAPASLDPYSSGGSHSPWPFDFGRYGQNSVNEPLAYATFVAEGWTGAMEPLLGGWAAASTRTRCGCSGRNSSSESYPERWNILVLHQKASASSGPTSSLTITVEAVDVCNGHGRWNPQTKQCACEEGFMRGSAPSLCAQANSWVAPCCLATCAHEGQLAEVAAAGLTLNCSHDAFAQMPAATSMPLTQPEGPQTPGQIPAASVLLYPGERAVFRLSSLPKNPTGNPWAISFRAAILLPPLAYTDPQNAMLMGGVHTCSTTAQCAALVPGVQPSDHANTNQWLTDPAKQSVTMPYEFGSLVQLYTKQRVQQLPLDQLRMEWNPVAAWNQADYPYAAALAGNLSTTLPAECLCRPEFHAAQQGAASFVPSDESFTLGTSMLSALHANMLNIYANYSDICGGHGAYTQGSGASTAGCACDPDYYGRACASPTASVTPIGPYGNLIQAATGSCCTAKALRPASPSAGGRIVAAGASGSAAMTVIAGTRVGVELKKVDVLSTDAPKNYYSYPSVSAVVYEIDPGTVDLGQSYSLRLENYYATNLASQCNLNEVSVQPHLVCGNYTATTCLDEVLRLNPASGSGQVINSVQYNVPIRSELRSSMCGCGVRYPREHSMLVRLVSNSQREQPCRFNLTATTATYECTPGRSVWDRLANGCTCLGTFVGPPACATNLAGATTALVPSGSSGGRSFTTATLSVAPQGYMFASIPVGNKPHSLNLNVTASGAASCSSRSYTLDFARCWNVTRTASMTDANRVFSPQETLDYATSIATWSSLATATANNPLRHCDTYSGLVATAPVIITRVTGSSYAFNYKQGSMGNALGSFSVVPQSLSPCRAVQGIGCDSDGQYWIVRALNSGATGTCSLTLTQTTGMGCEESMMSCSGNTATGGSCLPATAATSTYEGKAIPSGYGASCGACRPGFEGVGCFRPTPDYTELVNSDVATLTSVAGARMRFSLQVSPSNDPVTLTFKFSELDTSFYSSCGATCRFHRAPVWIRARLGRAPPALVTRIVSDEALRTFYVASDGIDEETNTTAVVEDETIDPSTGQPTVDSSSSTGAAAPMHYASSSSTGGASTQTLSWGGQISSLARRLLAVGDDSNPSLDATFPVYRNDLHTANETIELKFPSNGFRLYDHDFLYIDVYHGRMMYAGAAGAYTGAESAQTTTSMEVSVSVHDTLGTLVGWIALAILAGFAFVLLVYLIYLRCRYGSISSGVERSVLEKAKVQRGVAPAKSPEQLTKEAEKKRREREKLAAKKAAADAEGLCTRGVKLFFLCLAFALLLTFELLKVLFNISILHTSVGSFIPVVDFDSVAQSVETALNDIGLWRFHQAWATFNEFFSFLGIFNEFSLKWNCGGALSMFGPVVILIGSIVLIVILQKDYFLRFALSLKGSTEGTSTLGRKIRAAVAAMLSTGLLYLLQSSILVLAQVVASTWNIKRSCSAQDKVLVDVGRILCIVFIVLLFYVSALMFAGIKHINAHNLIAGWFSGVWALLQLSVGVWRQSTVARFDIAARAHAFDLDDNHDENPEEAVMELQGASRGLMWTAFPVGIVLTKLTEQINSPPVFIFGNNIGVTIDTPPWHRRLRWSVGMLRLCAVFYTVWRANQLIVLVSFGLTALGVALSIILPNDYHKKRWQATHPEKEIEMQGISSIVNRGSTP